MSRAVARPLGAGRPRGRRRPRQPRCGGPTGGDGPAQREPCGARLESELGVPLLRRGPRGSALTPQGTVVVHWAREVVADAGRLLDAADDAPRKLAGTELAVGASMTVAEHLVPAWLGELRRHHEDLRIQLQVHNSTQVFEQVEAGACDVGFVESPRCRAVSTAAPWRTIDSSSWSRPPIRGPGGGGRCSRKSWPRRRWSCASRARARERRSTTRCATSPAPSRCSSWPAARPFAPACSRASALPWSAPSRCATRSRPAPCGSSRWRGWS